MRKHDGDTRLNRELLIHVRQPRRNLWWATALAWLSLMTSCAGKVPVAAKAKPAPTPPAGPAVATPLQEEGPAPLEGLLTELRAAESASVAAPDDLQVWIKFATLLLQAHRTQEAARAAWHTVEIEPTFASWTTLGNVLTQGDVFMSMGAAVGAFQAYRMAAQQAPEGADAAKNFLNLAYRDFGLGHDKQALELIEEAEKISPRDPLVFFDRACVLAGSGQSEAAKRQAEKALALIDEQAPNQTPQDPIAAHMRPLAAAIVRGEPVERPGMLSSGEMLPERFWAKPPTRGTALQLSIDPTSDRYFPLVSTVGMRLRVPTQWAHRMKVTPKAMHLRMASPAGEAQSLLQVTVFPVAKENFNLKQAAEAGRRAAEQPQTQVGALMPLERKEGLAYWFESTDTKVDPNKAATGQYARLWQAFAFARPFAISATWLGQRPDPATHAALLELLRSFEVFRLEVSEGESAKP